MRKKSNEWYWLFRHKETGCVDLSRQPRPDFVALYESEGHIKNDYDRILVRFPNGRFDKEATKDKGAK